MSRLKSFGGMLLLLLAVAAAWAAPGDLDTTFSGDGLAFFNSDDPQNTARAIALQPDGKVVVAGYSHSFGMFTVLRFNADGTPDTSFSGDGVFQSSGGYALCVAIQPDGKIVTAGRQAPYVKIVRLNSNGGLDTTFSGDGLQTIQYGLDAEATSISILPDNKILLGGHQRADEATDNWNFALVKLKADGSLDSTFGSGGGVATSFFTGLDEFSLSHVVQPDEGIVLGGYSKGQGTGNDFTMARYLENGSMDSTFGTGGKLVTSLGSGNDAIRALALQPDGKIVAGGNMGGPIWSAVTACFGADGSLDTSFAGDGVLNLSLGAGIGEILALSLQPDGKIVAGGYGNGTHVNGVTQTGDFALYRITASGVLDTTFSTDGKVSTHVGTLDVVYGLALAPDGRIAAAGQADALMVVARYLGGPHPPAIGTVPDQTTREDVTLSGIAIAVSDPDTAASSLSLSASFNPSTLVQSHTFGGSGANRTLQIVPKANLSGTVTITLTVSDGLLTGMQTFQLTILPVNDAPSFTKGADQTVSEDAGPQVKSGWATNLGTGEAGQALSFEVTANTNAELFSAVPSVTSSGTLRYTPAANAHGSSDVTVRIRDNGGTANGGIDTSAAQTFRITVNSVNDAPSFVKGVDQTVNEDAGAQVVSSWASGISAGPANEAGQTLAFEVTGNTNPALFSTAPTVDPSGTLRYTSAADTAGFADISLRLNDDGGVENGGVEASGPQVFRITVSDVNDRPGFVKGADQFVNEDGGAQVIPGWATRISTGPEGEAAQALTFEITTNSNAALFSAGPVVDPNGDLRFTSAADQFGFADVTLVAKDNGGTSNGGSDTSLPQTFRITVTDVAEPPAAPTGLAALQLNGTAVQLTWSDQSSNETGFAVLRKLGVAGAPGAFEPIGSVTAGQTGYTDTGLTSGATYSYQVAATGEPLGSGPSNTATLTLIVDTIKPTIALSALRSGPPVQIDITVRDTGSGLASIAGLVAENCTLSIPTFAPGTTAGVVVTATKVNPTRSARVVLRAVDRFGNSVDGDPVVTEVVIPKNATRVVQTFTGIPSIESWVTVENGKPGLKRLEVTVNKTAPRAFALRNGQSQQVNLANRMQPGDTNVFTLVGYGLPGTRALVTIADAPSARRGSAAKVQWLAPGSGRLVNLEWRP